jgi:hypothetical protein
MECFIAGLLQLLHRNPIGCCKPVLLASTYGHSRQEIYVEVNRKYKSQLLHKPSLCFVFNSNKYMLQLNFEMYAFDWDQ